MFSSQSIATYHFNKIYRSLFDIAVIVLQAPSNRLADLKPLASKVLPILAVATIGQVTIVSA